MIKIIKRLIPQKIKEIVWNYRSPTLKHSSNLRTSTLFEDIGEPGPIITNIFDEIKQIPGWFNLDDCGHFHLILSMQSSLKIQGDIFEIGSYHGRSTTLLASCLKKSEKIVICDAFESETEDQYQNKPTPDNLICNIIRVNKELEKERIVIHKCLSDNLELDENEKFRFIHIDGGHSAEQAYFDLNFCKKHIISYGVMVMDDYHNKQWPGVTIGTDRFLDENKNYSIIADLNRHGAIGRKLYLINIPDVSEPTPT